MSHLTHRLLAVLAVAALAACTPGPATPTSSPSPSTSASPKASASPASSAAPTSPSPSAATGEPMLDTLSLKVDGAAITVENRAEYTVRDKNVAWNVGHPKGVAPDGMWYLNWGISFTKDPKAGGLTTSDVQIVTLVLYKGNGTLQPAAYQLTMIGTKGPAGEITMDGSKATFMVNGELSQVMGGSGKIMVEGTLAGTVK